MLSAFVLMLLAATLIVAVASALQAATGMGMALCAAPLLALLDPAFVPGPALCAVVALSAAVAWRWPAGGWGGRGGGGWPLVCPPGGRLGSAPPRFPPRRFGGGGPPPAGRALSARAARALLLRGRGASGGGGGGEKSAPRHIW